MKYTTFSTELDEKNVTFEHSRTCNLRTFSTCYKIFILFFFLKVKKSDKLVNNIQFFEQLNYG